MADKLIAITYTTLSKPDKAITKLCKEFSLTPKRFNMLLEYTSQGGNYIVVNRVATCYGTGY